MENLETIVIRFMGYNFLRGAVSEVSGSLKMIGGLSRETGQIMVDWNRRSEAAANAVGLAYQRYAGVVAESSARNVAATAAITDAQRELELVTDRASINGMLARNRVIEAEARYSKVVTASNKLIVDAAQDQALAFNRVEIAHLKVAEAAILQAKAESDLILISSREYSLADRADMNAAANDRLATALGLRAIAEQQATSEALLLTTADQRMAAVIAEVGTVTELAANKIAIANEKESLVAKQTASDIIAANQAISAAQTNLGRVYEASALQQVRAANAIKIANLDASLTTAAAASASSGAFGKITEATIATQVAQARYAATVEESNILVVNAAQDQAIAYLGLQAAHNRLTDSLVAEAAAQLNLASLSNAAFTSETAAADIYAAANARLTTAMGDRAAAELTAIGATAELMAADQAAAMIATNAAIEQTAAATAVSVAVGNEAAAVSAAMAMIATSIQEASAMAMGLGGAFLIAGGIAGAGLLFAAGKAGDFQSKLYLLHTQARVPLFVTVKENGITKTIDQMELLRKGILSMAGTTGFAANQLADAMYLIESQGAGTTTAKNALAILEAAAMGAAVGHSNLTSTAKALAATMQVFPNIANGPIGAMGALDAIVGQGMMTMEDLNAALRTGILATLKSSGVGLADFGGALATMTDYAIPATQAANSLRMAIYLMTAPTGASDKVLREFGLTTKEVSSISQDWTNKLEKAGIRHAQLADDLRKPGGIILAMQDLRKHLIAAGLDAEGQAEVIYKAFGGGKMGKAVITLYENIQTGTRASDAELRKLGFTTAEIATLNDRLKVKTDAVNQQMKLLGVNFLFIQSHDPAQMWKDFTAALDAGVKSLGYAFIPMLVSILGFLTPIVKGFTDWVENNQNLAAAIGGSAVALMLIFGTALLVLGALGMVAGAILAIGTVGLPVLGLVGGIFAGLVVAAGIFTAGVLFLHSIWDSMADLWNTRVVPAASRLWNVIQSVWKIIQDGLKITKPIFDAAFKSFKDTLTEHGGLWDNATQGIKDFSKGVLTFVKSPEFASLIADFAVYLPAAIGISLDQLLVFLDVAQGSFTLLAGQARVAFDLMTGNIAGAVKDSTDTVQNMAPITKRMFDDMNKTATDQGKLFNGTYQKMWQQAYNNTMDMTSKIGNDGAIQMQTAGQKMEAADLKAGIHRKAAAYRTFYDVGKNMTDGVTDGLNSGVGGLFHAIDKMMVDAAARAKVKNKSKSPSVLWGDEIGKPIPQGIWMGVQSEIPMLQRNIGNMLTNLLGPRTNTGSVSRAIVASVTPTGNTANQSAPAKPISTKKLEDLIEEANKLLRQIANEESSIDAFAAQRRNG